ncbi:MAG: hypothetical protein PVI24_12190 [Myxococcales bacterium]|jgi:hypothetical protein
MSKGDSPEQELRSLLPSSIAVRFEEMFPSLRKGKLSRRDRKRAKILRKAEPVLKRALGPLEVVRFATHGVRQLMWWLLTAGSMNPFANRTTLVLTNQRVLLIHTDWRYRPCLFANQLPVERIVETMGRNSYVFIRSPREQLMFHGVRRSEAQYLQSLLDSTDANEGGWQNLCPHCFTAIDGAPEACPSCGERFKSARRAALRSFLFPGLGDFYLGYRKYGLLEIAGAGALWGIFLSTLIPAVRLKGAAGMLLALPMLGLVALVHAGDAWLTRNKAKMGLHSKDGALPTDDEGSQPST